ncbi:MAG: hypothetical protein WBB07_28565 [Mycobacterium sp.]
MTRQGSDEQKIMAFTAQVAARIDAVVGKLTAIVSEMPMSEDEFGYFVDATKELLVQRDDGDALAGAGYAVDCTDSARPPAMVWWVERGGVVAERSHSSDPDSESFYDYAALRWFRNPRDSGDPTLSGPFIDTWGSDDYTVTVSVPVPGLSALRGVVAADVDVRRFIDSLAADLVRMPFPLALVNESDRVVVSTVPSLSTGLPITPRSARAKSETVVQQRFNVSNYGWSVVVLSS